LVPQLRDYGAASTGTEVRGQRSEVSGKKARGETTRFFAGIGRALEKIKAV